MGLKLKLVSRLIVELARPLILITLLLLGIGLLISPFARVFVENFVPEWIWQAEIRGRVIDEHGEPVVDARVVVEYFGDRSADVIPGSRSPAITDERGRFALTFVSGSVTVFARKDGVGISPPLDLEAEDEDEIADVELRLDPGGRVTGTCIDADGKPQPGRWVAIEQAGYRHWRDEERIAEMRTGESGEFAFDRVPSGEVRVMLGGLSPSAPSYPFREERVVTIEHGGTTDVLFRAQPIARDR